MEIVQREEIIDYFGGHEHLTMLHISDIHLWFSTGILERLELLIKLNDPDLVAFTGDYYDFPVGARNFRDFLIRISSGITVIFIRGNHDRFYGKKTAQLLLNIQGATCVEKECFRYRSKSGFFYNITSWENRVRLKRIPGEKNIILIHNPERLNPEGFSNVDLILAGHLHGGQVIFFKTRNRRHFPGCLLYKFCGDRFQIDDTTLIVSRGIGDTLPIRINCPREIVKITII